jgi:D-glycero-D-manno-heptose 1,7-bisphosphate phosphatase
MDFFRRLRNDTEFADKVWEIVENFPLALTIILAGLMGVFPSFTNQIEHEQVTGWILLVLVLLASSELLVRVRRTRKMENRLIELSNFTTFATDKLEILHKRVEVNNVLILRNKITEFEDRIKSANEILLCGITLQSIADKYCPLLEQKLNAGAVVKILVNTPDSRALGEIAQNDLNMTKRGELTNQIDESLKTFYRLHKSLTNPSNFEVRVIDVPMPFSIIATDATERHGRLHIEIYGHRWPVLERPHLELFKSDGVWFERFYGEFMRRWDSGSTFIPFPSTDILSSPKSKLDSSKPVVFLDRDGVINYRMPTGQYVTTPADFIFMPNAKEAIQRLLEKDFSVVVVTNQAGIARKMVSPENLEAIHKKLIDETAVFDKRITAIYVCPHEEKENCSCRKPKSGLIRRAIYELDIDLDSRGKRYLIGDTVSDIEAGERCGCVTIMLDNPDTKLPLGIHPRHIVTDLNEAVDMIMHRDG